MITKSRPIRIRMMVPILIAALLFASILIGASSGPKLGSSTEQRIARHFSEYTLTDEDIAALSTLQNFDQLPSDIMIPLGFIIGAIFKFKFHGDGGAVAAAIVNWINSHEELANSGTPMTNPTPARIQAVLLEIDKIPPKFWTDLQVALRKLAEVNPVSAGDKQWSKNILRACWSFLRRKVVAEKKGV